MLEGEDLTFSEEQVQDDGAVYRGQIKKTGERHGYGI